MGPAGMTENEVPAAADGIHMLATVGENGRFGVVAVGDSPDEAEQFYQRIQMVIKDEAERAIAMPLLPDKT